MIFKRNKLWRFFSFVLIACGCMLFASASSGDSMDIIAVYDMDAASIADFEAVRDYISGAFLKEFLRKGDTFHIISFAQTPRIELSRRIEGEGDYRTIIARIFLLYPLARTSSVDNAIRYTERFVSELPGSRPKKVVFFSAKPNLNEKELAQGFGANTDFYLAKITESFTALSSGRNMTDSKPSGTAESKPAVITEAPPKPSINTEPFVDNAPPDVSVNTGFGAQNDVEISVDVLPVYVDKRRLVFAILPFAALLIITTAVFGFAITREKRETFDDDDFSESEFLFGTAGAAEASEDDVDDGMDAQGQGLLRKAEKITDEENLDNRIYL